MIKLYKKIESNIGRGVVVLEYGRPCKRRIKAVAKGFTDFTGTRDIVDVSRGRFDDGHEHVCMFDTHTLDTVWDNWHAFMKDEVARLKCELDKIADKIRRLEQLEARHFQDMRVGDYVELARSRNYRDALGRKLDHWTALLERADEAQERRRQRREQKREADANA